MASSFGPNSELVERFLQRLAGLDITQLGEVIATWRAHLRRTDEWYGAEDAVGEAIARTRRYAEQWRLQDRLYELFRRSSWYTNLEPGTLVPACEAAAQYLASVAAFAVLVADAISPRAFATLYTPFAETITLQQLGLGESGPEAGDERAKSTVDREVREPPAP
jgi:hypothetical protein